MTAPGLYIHVPFCRTRCDFCAFYLRVYRPTDADRYVAALRREIDLHAERATLRGRPVQTVYFGGGTPSVLGADRLSSLLEHVSQLGIQPEAEVTFEAHPGDVDRLFAGTAAAGGCTRLSIGAQSFDAGELDALGRASPPQRIAEAVEQARRAGIRSVNLDLMYGLPGQHGAAWSVCLDTALALNPDHLSCYAFTIEEGTKTALDIGCSRLDAPAAEAQRRLEEVTAERLAAAGYERYEISNYARPGHRCRHNLLYWTDGDYLGLGPSAQSYVDGRRFGVKANLEGYCADLERGRLPIDGIDPLSERQRAVEAVIFGLRRLEGVDRRAIEQAAVIDPEWRRALARLIQENLVEEHSGRIRLTAHGVRFADTVAEALI